MIHMRPIASARANPKIAYEKSCCFNDGLRAQANIKQPKTTPIPIPVRMKKCQTLGEKINGKDGCTKIYNQIVGPIQSRIS